MICWRWWSSCGRGYNFGKFSYTNLRINFLYSLHGGWRKPVQYIAEVNINTMTADGTKRVIVIRDIPSSFVEEAILILKDDPEAYGHKKMQDGPESNASPGESILDEARKIIENYEKNCSRKARLKYAGARGLKEYLNPLNLILAAGFAAAVFFLFSMY